MHSTVDFSVYKIPYRWCWQQLRFISFSSVHGAFALSVHARKHVTRGDALGEDPIVQALCRGRSLISLCKSPGYVGGAKPFKILRLGALPRTSPASTCLMRLSTTYLLMLLVSLHYSKILEQLQQTKAERILSHTLISVSWSHFYNMLYTGKLEKEQRGANAPPALHLGEQGEQKCPFWSAI